MKCQFASFSDAGSRRKNEDSLILQNCGHSVFAAVADGVGGHANGQAASQIITDILGYKLTELPFCKESITQAVLQTGQILCDTAEAGYSTLASVWMKDYQAFAVHVGDSRVYQFRGNRIVYQSADHSFVQISVAMGDLKEKAIRTHKDRSKLYRVLGDANDTPMIECVALEILPGDRFLLCTDGFWEPVTEEDMLDACRASQTMEQWILEMNRIITELADPRQDNYSVICIEIP